MMYMETEIEIELETRKSVYDCISRFPGIHLRELQRRLEMPIGLLNFHIEYLLRNELIVEKTERYYKRYYIAGKFGSEDKRVLSALRQQNPRRIVLYLLLHPGSTHKRILGEFDLNPSTLSFYLKDLIDKGIIKRKKSGRESIYKVQTEEVIVRVLIAYKPSFLDKLVDRFLEIWFEEHQEAK